MHPEKRFSHVLLLTIVLSLLFYSFASPKMTCSAAEPTGKDIISICNRTEQVRVAIQKEVAAQRFLSGNGTAVQCQSIRRSELESINYLQIANRGLLSLQPGDFDGLTGLKTLDLEGNHLQTLNAPMLAGPTQLEALILARNPLKHANDALAALPHLKRVDLSCGQLPTLPASFFAANSSLEFVNLADNPLTALPDHLFSNNPSLTIVTLSGNKIRQMPPSLSDIGGSRVDAGSSRPAHPASTAQAATPPHESSVTRGIADLRYFVRSHWHLPLAVSVVYSDGDQTNPKNPALRAREERLALRQLEEVREAYRRAAFDFFHVGIRFEGPGSAKKSPLLSYNRKKMGIDIVLKAPSHSCGQSFVISDEQILETLADHFVRTRSIAWFRQESPGDLQAALKRDFSKVGGMDDELRFDIIRLDDLIDTAMSRMKQADEKKFFSESELTDARFIQFRVLLNLQRLENTMARWRLAVSDEDFPYPSEVRLLLTECSEMYRTYLDWFLNVVVGDRAAINVFSETWYHRNPIFKILDSEVPAGFFNLDGRVSTRIPSGAVRDLLRNRLNIPLMHYLHGMHSLDARVSEADIQRSPLAYQMDQAGKRIEANRRTLAKHKLSDTRAFKELWDARVKNSVKFPFYRVTMSVAIIIGDTRLAHPAPAITDDQIGDMKAHLKPGDILVERMDHYLSNAFLGGFWPHGILYLGPKQEWSRLKLADGTTLAEDPWIAKNILPKYVSAKDDRPALVMEAISDGVVFNSLEEAAQKDYIGIFRPKFGNGEQEAKIAAAIKRALRYHGRPYDFDFDFFTDDKLVCTELLYRAYHPDINFLIQKQAIKKPDPAVPGMIRKAGRDTMPANEIVKLALYMRDHQEPNPSIGYTGQTLEFVRLYMKQSEGRPAKILAGEDGIAELKRTLR